MTKTEAIRETMIGREESHALSLMDIQDVIRLKYGVISTDSSIGRRIRELGANCKRCSDGVYRYWLPKPAQQETLFAERRSA